MTSVNCRIAAPWVTAIGSGDSVAFVPVRTHIESCLYCQAGIARQRRLRRSLEDLASVSEVAPAGGPVVRGADENTISRPLLVGAVGAAVAIGIGVIGVRRSLAH